MRTLIIGANGYIGSAVARRLRECGHEVAGLARNEERAGKLAAAGRPAGPRQPDRSRGARIDQAARLRCRGVRSGHTVRGGTVRARRDAVGV